MEDTSKFLEDFELEPYMGKPEPEIVIKHNDNESPRLSFNERLAAMPITELMAELVDALLERRDRHDIKYYDIHRIESPYATELSRRLEMTTTQTILLSFLMNEEEGAQLTDIARPIFCNNLRLQVIYPELDELIERSYVNKYDTDYSTYIINPMARAALLNNQPYNYQVPTNLSTDDFFNHFEDSIGYLQLDKSRSKYQTAWHNIEQILIANQQLPFSATLLNSNLSDASRYLLCFMASYGLLHRQWVFTEEYIESVFEFFRSTSPASLSIVTRELKKTKMIEPSCLNGTVDEYSFCLTQEACNNMFIGLNLEQVQDETFSAFLTDSTTFHTKQLFFNDGDSEKIDQLAEFLQEENYRKICKRMADRGLMTGLTCLFHGESGCGKTETARMLAQKTKRMVMIVNLDELKSNHLGTTERNVKRVFARYNNLVKHMSKTPIMLIDNADAVLNDSIENSSNNSIRNIILKEMETFEGIMIAIANNTSDFNSAFDHRFLYKIEFHRPDTKTMSKIWKSYVPQITEAESDILAGNYSLTGGQIMNIARQLDINNLLLGKPITLQEIREVCDMEKAIPNTI